jgi:hypothetical protein
MTGFAWFPGARQRTGMSDCFDFPTRSQGVDEAYPALGEVFLGSFCQKPARSGVSLASFEQKTARFWLRFGFVLDIPLFVFIEMTASLV